MLSDEEVLAALRSALRDLYDTPALRANLLIAWLGLGDAPNAPSELRRILIEAIHAARPDVSVPAEAEAWRIYEILEYRYIQQCNQTEVARQLGLSIRHLRREEQRAAEVLAHRLQSCLGVDQDAPAASASMSADAINGELAWLAEDELPTDIDLDEALRAALELVRPLAQARGAQLTYAPPGAALRLSAHAAALRQVILGLLTVAIGHAENQVVAVRVLAGDGGVTIEIGSSIPCADLSDGRYNDTLAMVERLAHYCEAEVEISREGRPFTACLALPLRRQVSVLVIDDNHDTLRLLQRYASETPFHIIGVDGLEEALDMAAQAAPKIIVLDVMMPHVDGWEMLGHLRQHPLTRHMPIIVCSILSQEELALSLGASDYIRKPVSRQAFLQVLERQRYPAEPGSPPAPRRSAGTLAN